MNNKSEYRMIIYIALLTIAIYMNNYNILNGDISDGIAISFVLYILSAILHEIIEIIISIIKSIID